MQIEYICRMIDLVGKCALITGGSRGIGAASAELLARAGASVAITYSTDSKGARQQVRKIRSLGGNARAFRGRVEEWAFARRVAAATARHFGKIDILVTCAGVWEEGPIGSLSEKDWKRSIDINLTGTFAFASAVVPYMKRQGSGRIIFISSTAGQRGEPFHSHYAASKGGVIALTKSIAPELIPYGIYVNCIAPGWVDTRMVSRVLKIARKRREILSSIPRGKIATPREIAGPVLFLASQLSDNIVGEILNVNGGSVLCG